MNDCDNYQAAYQLASDAFGTWRDDVLQGKSPILYPIGKGALADIELGPGRVMLLGGAPGAGKTAFAMQAVVDALRLTPELRARLQHRNAAGSASRPPARSTVRHRAEIHPLPQAGN